MTHPTTVTDPYIISRSASEAERLDMQHRFILDCQGYYLHPSISSALSETEKPRIADLGTGTAIWLRELAKAMSGMECHGFDISDAMFPPIEELEGNVELHVQDIKKAFEAKWMGYFDVVHVRLVQAAMISKEEWAPLLRNITALLKPGGWIQWVESDRAVSVRHSLRAVAPLGAAERSLHPDPTWQPPRLKNLHSFNRALMPDERVEAMTFGFLNLDLLMSDRHVGNLETVFVDGYVLDRQDDGGEFRRNLAEMGITTVGSMLKAKGEEFEKGWEEKAREEVERGGHFITRMKVFVGRKK